MINFTLDIVHFFNSLVFFSINHLF